MQSWTILKCCSSQWAIFNLASYFIMYLSNKPSYYFTFSVDRLSRHSKQKYSRGKEIPESLFTFPDLINRNGSVYIILVHQNTTLYALTLSKTFSETPTIIFLRCLVFLVLSFSFIILFKHSQPLVFISRFCICHLGCFLPKQYVMPASQKEL